MNLPSKLPSDLKARIRKDSVETNRSVETIVEVALEQFYRNGIVNRRAILGCAKATKSGRRPTV
jgi:hypothetical protein